MLKNEAPVIRTAQCSESTQENCIDSLQEKPRQEARERSRGAAAAERNKPANPNKFVFVFWPGLLVGPPLLTRLQQRFL